MAPHSSALARKIPWMEEPGGLQSMGSLRVRHYQATSLPLFPFMHWRRKWQPTPVFLPGESQGQGSLVGGHLWGLTISDTTGVTQQQLAAAREKNDTYQFKKPSFSKYLRKHYPNVQKGNISQHTNGHIDKTMTITYLQQSLRRENTQLFNRNVFVYLKFKLQW